MSNIDYWLNKIKKCKYPCFEEGDDIIEECLCFEKNPECIHLEEGGSWLDCKSGALNQIYKEYINTSKMPEVDGYYLVWSAGGAGIDLESESIPLGLVCRHSGGLFWSFSGMDAGEITSWVDNWWWSRILTKPKKEDGE
jgi:hypothetical protein